MPKIRKKTEKIKELNVERKKVSMKNKNMGKYIQNGKTIGTHHKRKNKKK
jgi:hypothetical protein